MVTLSSEKSPCLSLKSTIISAFLVPTQRAMPLSVSSILPGSGTNLQSFGLLLPVQPQAAIVFSYLIVVATEDSRTTAYTGRWVMCESHHPPLPVSTNHPHMRGCTSYHRKKRGNSLQNNHSPLQHPRWPSKFRNFLENKKSWAL